MKKNPNKKLDNYWIKLEMDVNKFWVKFAILSWYFIMLQMLVMKMNNLLMNFEMIVKRGRN